MSNIRIAANGWQHEPWLDSFYPDDLPEDWQFGYYANEYHAALVPAANWMDESALVTWIDDIPKDFSIFLQLDDLGYPTDQVAKQLARLQVWLNGVYIPQAISPDLFKIVSPDLCVSGLTYSPVWTPESLADNSCMGIISEAPANTRQLRDWVESFKQASAGKRQAFLCFDAFPGSLTLMHDAGIIADLL